MLARGVPLKVVSEILGHSSIVITGDVYGYVSPDVSREALATLSAVLNRPAPRMVVKNGGQTAPDNSRARSRSPGIGP
ncbi:MAG: Phage integrase [Modestobacter sp.]|nr:Phage integrase [Modestobacter sp.]